MGHERDVLFLWFSWYFLVIVLNHALAGLHFWFTGNILGFMFLVYFRLMSDPLETLAGFLVDRRESIDVTQW